MCFVTGCLTGTVITAILGLMLLLLVVSRDMDREDEIRKEEP